MITQEMREAERKQRELLQSTNECCRCAYIGMTHTDKSKKLGNCQCECHVDIVSPRE